MYIDFEDSFSVLSKKINFEIKNGLIATRFILDSYNKMLNILEGDSQYKSIYTEKLLWFEFGKDSPLSLEEKKEEIVEKIKIYEFKLNEIISLSNEIKTFNSETVPLSSKSKDAFKVAFNTFLNEKGLLIENDKEISTYLNEKGLLIESDKKISSRVDLCREIFSNRLLNLEFDVDIMYSNYLGRSHFFETFDKSKKVLELKTQSANDLLLYPIETPVNHVGVEYETYSILSNNKEELKDLFWKRVEEYDILKTYFCREGNTERLKDSYPQLFEIISSSYENRFPIMIKYINESLSKEFKENALISFSESVDGTLERMLSSHNNIEHAKDTKVLEKRIFQKLQ